MQFRRCSSSSVLCQNSVLVCVWGGGGRGRGRGRRVLVRQRCCVRHRGVQLILAYSWTRSAILAAGKVEGRGGGGGEEGGGGGRIFSILLFLHFHSVSSFSPVPLFHLYYLFCLTSPYLWETTQMTHKG